MFCKEGVMIATEDVGAAMSHAVRLCAATGRCTIHLVGEESYL